MNHKKDGLIFNKSEGHWTELGALYGFECISRFIASKDKDIGVVDASHYKITEEVVNFPPIAYHQKLPRVRNSELKYTINKVFENFDNTVYIHNNNYGYKSKPKTLIIGDSFMESSRQFIADAFHNAYEIHSQQQGLGFKVIENYAPKNIIYILTERFLNNLFYDISEIPPEKNLKIYSPAIPGKYNIDGLDINKERIKLAGWLHDSYGIEPHRIVIAVNNVPIYQSNPNRNRPDLNKTNNSLGFDYVVNNNFVINSIDIVPFYFDGTSEKIRIYP